ncbi:transporter substrate-binding domain-containing protein [Roseixanthobacter liquoris]|uniref:transporter substrate-binding domain-containing protein n=1 Tax=Roseixanthobacter liquoris TaxID=3119921 RepID=UPI00372AB461
MTKRNLLAGWLALCVATVGALPATAADAPRSRLDAVAASGTLRICTTGDYRPFTLAIAGTDKFEGIDIDLAEDLAAALGAKPRFVKTGWPTLMTDFAADACDIAMGGISITLPRQKAAYFSIPYLRDGKTPIVRCADVEKYQTLAAIDQPGVRVVVNPGGTNESFARSALKAAQVREFPDNTLIFEEILAGRADVMMTDAVETRLQEKRHPGLCAVHPDAPFTFAEKAYLLPRGDDVFKAFVDQWLHLRLNDGTFARISAAHMR